MTDIIMLDEINWLSVAQHEVGHAFMAVASGFVVTEVYIKTKEEVHPGPMQTLGLCSLHPAQMGSQYHIAKQTEGGMRHYMERIIAGSFAGSLAEQYFLRNELEYTQWITNSTGMCSQDIYDADRMAHCRWDAGEINITHVERELLYEKTRKTIVENASIIRSVATLLFYEKKMKGKDITRLLMRWPFARNSLKL